MKMFSVGKAAEYLGRSRSTLQRWDREGTLQAERLPSGRRAYAQAVLDEHLYGLRNYKKSLKEALKP